MCSVLDTKQAKELHKLTHLFVEQICGPIPNGRILKQRGKVRRLGDPHPIGCVVDHPLSLVFWQSLLGVLFELPTLPERPRFILILLWSLKLLNELLQHSSPQL